MIFAIAHTSFGFAAPAQPPHKSRAERIVDERMTRLPKGLKLSASQRVALRALLVDTSGREEHVIRTVPGWFRQRVAIGKIARETQEREKKILTPAQYLLFDKKSPSAPGSRGPRVGAG